MQVEPTKLTDSLERQLNEAEIAAYRGAAFAGGISVRPLIRLAGRLAATMRFLRSQARRAKVDYAAG
jgi:hypothetical protein